VDRSRTYRGGETRARGTAPAKEKIYHSHLSKTPEGIKLRFTSNTHDSKFADSGGYVFAETEDGTEVMMILENQDIRDAVDGAQQKVWYTVRGEGKGDGAWIILDDDDGNPVLPERKESKPRAKHEGGPEPTEGAWDGIARTAIGLTLMAAEEFKNAGIPFDGESMSRIYNTHFIAVDRRA